MALLYIKKSDFLPFTIVAMDQISIAPLAAESRVLIIMTGYVLFGKMPSYSELIRRRETCLGTEENLPTLCSLKYVTSRGWCREQEMLILNYSLAEPFR